MPGGQFDANRIGCALTGVVKTQPFADFAGFHPDRGVVARFIAGGAAEDVDADGSLFEHVGPAGQSVLHHVADKILAALARMEFVAGKDTVQLLANRVFRYSSFCWDAPGADPWVILKPPVKTGFDCNTQRDSKQARSIR